MSAVSAPCIYQEIPTEKIVGTTITVSMKLGNFALGGLSAGPGFIEFKTSTGASSGINKILSDASQGDIVTASFDIPSDADIKFIAFSAYWLCSMEIEWVKLELGEFSTNFVAPNLETELERVHQYYGKNPLREGWYDSSNNKMTLKGILTNPKYPYPYNVRINSSTAPEGDTSGLYIPDIGLHGTTTDDIWWDIHYYPDTIDKTNSILIAYSGEGVRVKNGNGEWINVGGGSSGGDAATFAGKGINEFMIFRGDISDCNNAIIMGTYNTIPATINTPYSSYWHITTVVADYGRWVIQTAAECNAAANTVIYIRICINGDWNSWVRCNDGGNADTLDGKHASDLVQWLGKITSTDIVNDPNYAVAYECNLMPAAAIDIGLGNARYHLKYFRHEDIGTFGWGVQIAIPLTNATILPKYRCAANNETSWSKWYNFADGGNANTVENKSVAQLMTLGMNYADRTKISEGDLNDYTNAGLFVVTKADQASAISNSPFTNTGYYLDVYYRATGYYVQIAMNWNGLIKIRSCMNSTWGDWKNISDGGNANTVNGRSTSGNSSLIRYDCLSSTTDANTLISTGIYTGIFTNYPSGARDGQGTLVVINYKVGNDEATGTMGDAAKRWINQWFITPHTNDVYCRSCIGTSVSDWVKTNDGGAAATATYSSFANNASTLADTTSNVCLRDIYAGTSDMTAGTTALKTGAIYLVYE